MTLVKLIGHENRTVTLEYAGASIPGLKDSQFLLKRKWSTVDLESVRIAVLVHLGIPLPDTFTCELHYDSPDHQTRKDKPAIPKKPRLQQYPVLERTWTDLLAPSR